MPASWHHGVSFIHLMMKKNRCSSQKIITFALMTHNEVI